MSQELFLVYDIETIPLPYDSLSESQQEYIVRGANNEEEKAKKLGEMALSPLTARVVCIGLQLVEYQDGKYDIKHKSAFSVTDNLDDEKIRLEKKLTTGDTCFLSSEKKVIEDFWAIIKKYNTVHLISFNGRNFDAPFLMLRSALLNIRPSRNPMEGTKFNYPLHTDLMDELTFYNPGFYGATRRYNFDFYTRAFGIASPKSEGIDGSKVADYFANGRILEISEYCLRDVKATWELYLVWKEYLKF